MLDQGLLCYFVSVFQFIIRLTQSNFQTNDSSYVYSYFTGISVISNNMGLCFPFIENTVVFLNQGYRLS